MFQIYGTQLHRKICIRRHKLTSFSGMNNIAVEIICSECFLVTDYSHCRKLVCVSVPAPHTMKDHPSFNGSSTNNDHLFSQETWYRSSHSERYSVIITHWCLNHTYETQLPSFTPWCISIEISFESSQKESSFLPIF